MQHVAHRGEEEVPDFVVKSLSPFSSRTSQRHPGSHPRENVCACVSPPDLYRIILHTSLNACDKYLLITVQIAGCHGKQGCCYAVTAFVRAVHAHVGRRTYMYRTLQKRLGDG